MPTIDQSEAVAKAALLSFLRASRELKNAAIISELLIDGQQNRADIVLAGNQLHCFEIKTAQDTLLRLERQIAAYRKCFDRVTIVAAPKHIQHILERCGSDLGIIVMESVKGRFSLWQMRAALRNQDRTIPGLLSLLPMKIIKETFSLATSVSRADLSELSGTIPLNVAQQKVISFLKERYLDSTQAFLSTCRSRKIDKRDIARLRIWGNAARRMPENSLDSLDWEVFGSIGHSFGPVPKEIEEDVASAFSLPIPLQ